MLKLWRELLISNVIVNRESIDVQFDDPSFISFHMDKRYLKRYGVNWRHLAKGRRILVKGREGNEDIHFTRLDHLKEIVLIPERK